MKRLLAAVLLLAALPARALDLGPARESYRRTLPYRDSYTLPLLGEERFEELLAETESLDAEIGTAQDLKTLGALNRRLNDLKGEADFYRLGELTKVLRGLRKRLDGICVKVISAELELLDSDIAALGRARGDAGEAGERLFDRFKAVSLAIDHMGDPRGNETAVRLRVRANRAAQALADVRDALLGREKPPRRVEEGPDSATVGDPRRRAAFVHQQRGQSCSIVSQQQILAEHHRIEQGDPERTEDELFREARRRGYYRPWRSVSRANPFSRDRGSTRWEYSGDLLLDHGLIIAKHDRAEDKELFEAALSGEMFMADVDAGILWETGGTCFHTIVVTGAEVSKPDGRILGFYINDSGRNEGGRRVAAELFLRAWRAAGRRFIRVL